MTPFRSPFAPMVPSPWGRRFYLGAIQPAPRAEPDPWAAWVQTGANVFRAIGTDSARLWNAIFPDSQISVPGVGGAASAVGVGQSAFDIAQRGPSVQNVSGVVLGSARTAQGAAQLFGEGGSATSGAVGVIGPVASVAGLGLGAWQLAEHPSPGAATGVAVGAASTTGYVASALSLEGLSSLASVATPMTAVVALPFIFGAIATPVFRALGWTSAGVHWPAGYIQTPGSEGDVISAVDTATGRVLTYDTQRGVYAWTDDTNAGLPASPAQFTAWGIQPTGALALRPGYRDVEKFRDEMVLAVLQGAPAGLPYDVTQNYMMERRAPAILDLHQADPMASPGEIWRQYTLTPEYEQDQAMQAALTDQHRGGDS